MTEDAGGGFQVLLTLKGCGSEDGLFLKKCLSLLLLSKRICELSVRRGLVRYEVQT